MDFFTYNEVAAFVVILLAICGAIVLVGSAAKVVIDLLKPKQALNDRLHHYDECLSNDDKRLTDLEQSNHLLLRGLMTLISHEIDGNHTVQLTESRDAINEFLINRM